MFEILVKFVDHTEPDVFTSAIIPLMLTEMGVEWIALKDTCEIIFVSENGFLVPV